jgi:hypothetical protein
MIPCLGVVDVHIPPPPPQVLLLFSQKTEERNRKSNTKKHNANLDNSFRTFEI